MSLKKTLCLLLATTMLFSASVFTFANDYSIPFTLCDTTAYWSFASSVRHIEISENENSLMQICNSVTNGGDLVMAYTAPTPLDASVYHYLEFDWYISDVRIFTNNTQMQLEITSSGTCDIDEKTWLSSDFLSLHNGWNHVCLDVEGGATDTSRINFFRFYALDVAIDGVDKVEIKFDSMYLTDGNGVNAEPVSWDTFDSTYTPPAAEPDTFKSIKIGDIDFDGEVSLSDAMLAFRNVAGKGYLYGNETVAADTDGENDVTLSDAMRIFMRVTGKEIDFPADMPTNKIATEYNLNTLHIVHTTYETASPVVAICDVIAFGANGDGVTDDTKAFDLALTYAAALGGGNVFVPAGIYRINGNIAVPDGVTLIGDKPFSENMLENPKAVGTVICAYASREDESGRAFITLGAGSGIKNMNIWYPEQTAENPVAYPPTIFKENTTANIYNINLINSYSGIRLSPIHNALENIEYVHGTPLKTGLFVDMCVDICRVENMCFSPVFWAECGLGEKQDEAAIRRQTYTYAEAFHLERIDWSYYSNIYVDGYSRAFGTYLSEARPADISSNGQLYGFEFVNCDTGFYLETANFIGHVFTNGKIDAVTPVYSSIITNASFKQVDFTYSGENAVKSVNNANLSFSDCTFTPTSENSVTIDAPQGFVSANGCTFNGSCKNYIAANAKAKIINPTAENAELIESDCSGCLLIYDDSEVIPELPEEPNYDYVFYMRPGADNLIDLSAAPYSVMPETTEDIAPALQAAIDSLYAQGGGIVYVPGGVYRLESPITVKKGVEIRGSIDGSNHTSSLSTEFYTNYGENADENAQALITLEGYSGIRGFKVFYDRQDYTEGNVKPYAYTLRGNGKNIYVFGVTLCNTFRGADFTTNRCDNMYIYALNGAQLQTAVAIGGGSVNAIVRDCHFNPHFAKATVVAHSAEFIDIWKQQYTYADGFVVNDVHNATMFNNFIYGTRAGLKINTGAQNLFVLGHGTDGAQKGLEINGEIGENINLINTQLAPFVGKDITAVDMTDGTNGTVTMFQTLIWAYGLLSLESGELHFYQGAIATTGYVAAYLEKGRAEIAGVCTNCVNVPTYLLMTDNTELHIFGNIYNTTQNNEPKYRPKYGEVYGSDAVIQ